MNELHLNFRVLTSSDLSAAMHLKALAGWNQTTQDWQRLLDHDPAGCFGAWCGERLVGTATSTAYGSALAWIGMVLVDPEFRRRGIASALMRLVLAQLRARGVQTIKLDATAAGRGVYETLGFVEESLIERWLGVAPPASRASAGQAVRELQAADWPEVLALDRRAFGADRARLLADLHSSALVALVNQSENPLESPAESPSGSLAKSNLQGFALARSGAHHAYLGPLVATHEAAALALLEALLARLAGQTVFVDLNAQLASGASWLAARGFVKQRELLRMRAGQASASGTSPFVLAVAGLELG